MVSFFGTAETNKYWKKNNFLYYYYRAVTRGSTGGTCTPPIRAKGPLFITMFFLVCLFYKISTQLIKEIFAYEKKLSFANKKRLLLLFVLLIGSFLFDVHPPSKFSGYGPLLLLENILQLEKKKAKRKKKTLDTVDSNCTMLYV